ncbi:triose-phosphate isomerase [Labrys monachus]|uniref:triose-phosphate isomerase n=1 Tax=Labrys monachus TaxID=217067 RepID=UPI003520C685
MKRPWIGTSWKMNKTRAEAEAFARALAASKVASTRKVLPFVIPPFTAIAGVAEILSGTAVRVGAQNMHWAEAGAWTGEISAPMIKDAGATMVELGHSERRIHFGETDETVALKVKAALAHGLLALVCVGDTRAEFEAGATASALARQVEAVFSVTEPSQLSRVVIAYEPVWSIGEGGVPADPDFADEQHALIKKQAVARYGMPIDVVYGGSVNPANCRELAARPSIDGLFIGRSAWDVQGYVGIVESVCESLPGA